MRGVGGALGCDALLAGLVVTACGNSASSSRAGASGSAQKAARPVSDALLEWTPSGWRELKP
jgi:hypothetical protein